MPRAAAAARPAVADPGDRAVRFFQKRLRHVKDRWYGQPFLLEPWQEQDIIRPLFGTVDARGLRWFRDGLIGVARKNGKSETAAGIGLYGTFADGHYDPKTGLWVPEWGAEVYVCAGSRAQARIIFETARRMVLADPMLRAMTGGAIYKDAIEVPETGAVFRVLSSDAKLAHGYNPSMAILDELHVHPNDELLEAMVTGTGARQQPLVLAITTAGHDRESIAYRLYDRGRKQRGRSRFFFYWREAPAGCRIDDMKAIKKANPASWITPAYLRGQLRKPGMTEFSYRRLHGNQWTSAQDRVIPRERWDACKGRPTFPSGSELILAIDVAPRGRDRTILIATRRDEDRQIHARLRVFEVDPDIGAIDYEEVKDAIREYARAFDVREAVFDPYYFDASSMELAAEGITMVEFPQNDARMVPASQVLYDVIVEGRLRHGGDRTLTAHADNAGAKETSRGWRFHKAKSSGPIDGIIGLTMACDRWERGDPEQEGEVAVL